MNTEMTVERQAQPTEVTAERTRNRATYSPNVDILETADELTVLADMPGLRPEDVEIQFENGTLTICGNVADRQNENTRFLRREYGVGDYFRSFQVSEVVDSDNIAAEYVDGVLTLHLPKVAQARPRRIEVQGN
jgi:HSP20 family protein